LLLYYITDRTQFPGDESARRSSLLKKISEAARCGVDFIQLREKDLSPRELEALARAAVQTVREDSAQRTRLLINSRTDIAIASGADGVHLRSDDLSPSKAAEIWKRSRGGREPTAAVIGVSCHTVDDALGAAAEGATFAVLAPVFEKKDAPTTSPAGLASLREASRHKIPVLALGGVTLENAKSCMEVGAAGVAGIRLFQENDIEKTVKILRERD